MKKKFAWGSFSVLAVAHMINDMYSNFLPQLLPVLTLTQGFSVHAGATLVAAFTISSSLLQPLFGYLVDQKGQRWLVFVGTLWMSLLLGTIGFISNYNLLIVTAAIAGLGSAAFHPQAAAMVGELGYNRKGLILAMFTAAGNIGLALSPLILLQLFHVYGTKITWVAVFPGLLGAILLYFFSPRSERKQNKSGGLRPVFKALRKSAGELSKLMVIVAIRSLVHTGLMTLLPLYLLAKNFSPQSTGNLLFATLAMGALGGVIGGIISDKYGRKVLIIGSLALASVFFWGFLNTGELVSFIMLVLGGMALLSSFSVTVAAAQEIIPESKALASGLSLGFAIGIGGLAVSPVGKYADLYGVDAAVHLVFILPIFAAILAVFLKDQVGAEKIEQEAAK
ncbi:MAG TPA: MFS transporter [Candidatus Deferrimicrobium sp.]|nr:MFS transporter [Candidatus Deferrimicrobium sp.]